MVRTSGTTPERRAEVMASALKVPALMYEIDAATEPKTIILCDDVARAETGHGCT